MMRAGLLARAAAALGMIVAVPLASSAQARVAQPPVVTETVTVGGSGAAYTTVRVAERLDFRRAALPVLKASHPDRLDGLVLIRVAPGSASPGVAILGPRGGASNSSSYVFLGTDNGNQVSGTPVFVKRTLEPGTYRLLLLTQGANTVTLTFPGARRGSTKLSAATPTRYAAHKVTGVGASGAAVAPGLSASTTFTARTRPLQLAFASLRSTSAATRFHACVTQNPDAADTALASTPYCLAMAGVNSFTPGADRTDNYQAFHSPAVGTWQFKSFVAAAGVVAEGSVLSVQIELGSGFPLD